MLPGERKKDIWRYLTVIYSFQLQFPAKKDSAPTSGAESENISLNAFRDFVSYLTSTVQPFVSATVPVWMP